MFSKFSRTPFHPPELSLAVPSAYSSLHSHYVSWNKYTTRFLRVKENFKRNGGWGIFLSDFFAFKNDFYFLPQNNWHSDLIIELGKAILYNRK